MSGYANSVAGDVRKEEEDARMESVFSSGRKRSSAMFSSSLSSARLAASMDRRASTMFSSAATGIDMCIRRRLLAWMWPSGGGVCRGGGSLAGHRWPFTRNGEEEEDVVE